MTTEEQPAHPPVKPSETVLGKSIEAKRVTREGERRRTEEYFMATIQGLEAEGRLTEERINDAYRRCKADILGANMRHLEESLDAVHESYLSKFRELQSRGTTAVADLIVDSAASTEEPQPSLPGEMAPEPGQEARQKLDGMREGVKRISERVLALQNEITTENTNGLAPETRRSLIVSVGLIDENIRDVHRCLEAIDGALSRKAPREVVAGSMALVSYMISMVDRSIQQFEAHRASVMPQESKLLSIEKKPPQPSAHREQPKEGISRKTKRVPPEKPESPYVKIRDLPRGQQLDARTGAPVPSQPPLWKKVLDLFFSPRPRSRQRFGYRRRDRADD